MSLHLTMRRCRALCLSAGKLTLRSPLTNLPMEPFFHANVPLRELIQEYVKAKREARRRRGKRT